MFESDLHYTDEKCNFSTLFQGAKKLLFSHAVRKITVANRIPAKINISEYDL